MVVRPRRGCPAHSRRYRPLRLERIGELKEAEGRDLIYSAWAGDPWGRNVCDDGSCPWCQRMELEYRFEQLLAGEVFETRTPPLRVPVLR